jgi:guanylate kinase
MEREGARATREPAHPRLVAVAGPPGAGKTSAVNGVLTSCRVVFRPPTVSTRPARPGEEYSGQYSYLTPRAYERLKDSSDLLASYPSFGLHHYGVTRTALAAVPPGMVPLMEIDPRNIHQLRRHIPVVAVLILSVCAHDTLKRLHSRAVRNDGLGLAARWQGGIDLLEFGEPMDYVIINESLEQAVADLRVVVESEWLAAQAVRRREHTITIIAQMKRLAARAVAL